jgi:hypothetical protein
MLSVGDLVSLGLALAVVPSHLAEIDLNGTSKAELQT